MQRRRRRGIITLRNCADYENVENPAGETSEGGGEEGGRELLLAGKYYREGGGEGREGGRSCLLFFNGT